MIDILADWWQQNAIAFCVGCVLLTAAGSIAVAISKQPVQRQRLAELTVCAVIAWLGLALLPRTANQPAVETEGVVVSIEAAAHTSTPIPTAWTEPAADPIDLASAFGAAVRVGAILFAFYLLTARVLLRRLLSRASAAPERLLELNASLPIADRGARLVVSPETARPFCCGLWRPHIVLPMQCAQLDMRAVLLHEHAHLQQRDLLGQSLFALVLPLLYWNPLFWWLRREARLAAELVADDVAARHLDKATYVRELIDLAEISPGAKREERVTALAVVGHETEFFRRMKMLMTRKTRLTTHCSRFHTFARTAGAIALAFAASFAWTAPNVLAQQTQDPSVAQQKASSKTPAAPAAEGARTRRFEVVVEFADDKELGELLSKIATSGAKIETLDLPTKKRKSAGNRATLRLRTTEQTKMTRMLTSSCNAVSLRPIMAKRPKSTQPSPAKTPAPKPAAKPAAKPVPSKDDSPRVAFAFENADIREVIATVAKVSSMNIVTAPEVQGTITMQVRDVTARKALEAAVETLGYVITEDSARILRITTPSAASKLKK